MAHFAKLDNNNRVIAVHVVNNDVITIDGNESEQAGIDFLTSLHGHNNWKQTSYNNSFRGKFAAINDFYDETLDEFIVPKTWASWVFNETTFQWEPPIPMPLDNKMYKWNEKTLSWDEVIVS
jgi:hypothetical protein